MNTSWFIEKAIGVILATIVVFYLATRVLGMGYTVEGGFDIGKAGITQTATNTASCFDQIGSQTLSANCKSITIGNTKIGE